MLKCLIYVSKNGLKWPFLDSRFFRNTCCSKRAAQNMLLKTYCSKRAAQNVLLKTCCSKRAAQNGLLKTCCSKRYSSWGFIIFP